MRLNRRSLMLAGSMLPLATLSLANAQSSTPDASPVSGESGSRMQTMLSYLPGGLLDQRLEVTWVDLESQVAALSSSTGEGMDPLELIAQSQFGNMPQFFQHSEVLGDDIGFTTVDILQATSCGLPPSFTQIFELAIPAADLPAVWEQSGYEKLENDLGEYWSLGPDLEFDLSHPVQRVAMASLNHVAILNDHTIAFSSNEQLLEWVMSAAAGEGPGLYAELEPIAVGVPADAVSAWFVEGANLEFTGVEGQGPSTEQMNEKIEKMLADSDEAVGPMPVIRTISIGTTAGAARREDLNVEDAAVWIALETDESDQAEQAGAVVEWRMANFISIMTAAPFADIVGPVEVEVMSDSVVRISARGEAALGARFFQMLMNRDVLPFAWVSEES